MNRLQQRSQFYRNLAILEDAGLPRLRALEQSHPGVFDRIAPKLLDTMKGGATLSEAMEAFPRLFSPLECNLVRVGEDTGNSVMAFTALADWYEFRNRLRSQLISGLLYPIMVYHVAAVLIPFVSVVTGRASTQDGIRQTVIMLGVPYTLCFVCAVLIPGLYPGGVPMPSVVGRILLEMPLVGAISYKLNATRFFRALSVCLKAGVGTMQAVRLSAGTCTNSWLRSRYHRIAETVETTGMTFTQALRQNVLRRDKSAMIVTMLETGEVSGNLPEMAERIADVSGDEAARLLERVTTIGPVLAYLCIAAYIGFKVVQFYGALLEPVRELL